MRQIAAVISDFPAWDVVPTTIIDFINNYRLFKTRAEWGKRWVKGIRERGEWKKGEKELFSKKSPCPSVPCLLVFPLPKL